MEKIEGRLSKVAQGRLNQVILTIGRDTFTKRDLIELTWPFFAAAHLLKLP
jgi:hypothetical protein